MRSPRLPAGAATITYPDDLPISAHREEIARAIREHQVVIVAGATGSGKTTQLPKIALELGRGTAGRIGHTQPRRIAARTVAERLAAELGTELGTTVGYQVRFADTTSASTAIRVMTDGILLAQIQRDPHLRQYDTLIIDEAHERSLNIDFILGYLTKLLPQRPDLKVIITSATIDTERFAAHFAATLHDEVPVIHVEGRTFPVEIRYRPLTLELPGRPVIERDQPSALCAAVDELMAAGPGDILIFLTGEREIRDAADFLASHLRGARDTELLPLYGRLSAAEQHRVFTAHSGRRIVLATNVAETSLTVPGVRYVVDTGTARISRYSKATKVQRLPIEPISQASANQRSGRCGRLADGIAIRLYAQEDFLARPQFTEPEILRTSLAAVILHMVSSGVVQTLAEVATFPFLDPPDARAIRDGVALLRELGALAPAAGSTRARLTATGRAMAALPLDPRLARMVVEAGQHEVAREVVIIAAALSIQDVRERPSDGRAAADALHARFADPTSDFISYLNLWEYIRGARAELSASAWRRRLRSEHLHFVRVREWQDLVAQIREAAKDAGVQINPVRHVDKLQVKDTKVVRTGAAGAAAYAVDTERTDDFRRDWDGEPIHRSLLVGLLGNIGVAITTEVGAATGRRKRKALTEYAGARGARFAIFPGSALAGRSPDLVMAGELVETTRLWARDVAAVQTEWVLAAGAHLLKRSYAHPRWSASKGAALITEKVTLLGVPLIADQPVLLGKVDPAAAREMFIRQALVEGKWRTHHRFWHRNEQARQEAAELAARARRYDAVAGEEVLERFYDERLPASIISARHFDTWRARAGRTVDLVFPPELLLTDAARDLDPAQFPTCWRQGEMELAVSYEFTPGAPADGMVVHIPLEILARVADAGFDWLVPGRRVELVTALIRCLPKAQRTPLVPAPDMARRLVPHLEGAPEQTGGLSQEITVALAAAVRHLGMALDPGAFDLTRLPTHLRPTFRIEHPAGHHSDGPDLVTLQRQLAPEASIAMSTVVKTALAAARRPAPAAGAGAARPRPGEGAPAATWEPALPVPAHLAELIGTTVTTVDVQLPPVIEAAQVVSYPGLEVTGADGPDASVRIGLFASARTRDRRTRRAVRHLLAQELGLAPARVTSRWSSALALQLAAHPYPTTESLVADLHVAAIDCLLQPRGGSCLPTPAQYAGDRDYLRGRLEDQILHLAVLAGPALVAARELRLRLDAVSSLALVGAAADLRGWLDRLVGPGFIAAAGATHLPHLPRYLQAGGMRLDTAVTHRAREDAARYQLGQVETELQAVSAGLTDPSPAQQDALAQVGWLVQELRVSLFAQTLGTAQPVSAKRIRAALAAVHQL